ncbi:2-hydroxy-3-carboxy-6-oxo-7-methylocta-2, 4-dienoate decarboxylase [Rhodococcus opacus M213]|uniref:2-hydroxy-3-carboxy-6-oxo-7-methylocta-2, 4-dienoate decarboxylase n=1 Tax=Rhodococcus opacus M213 TaxID=1129896 RepID=K8XJ84_RHOOP|nr:amidohydrolase family protein [Rhodococcus opacus]EKT81459.1 2-hydroxy-3-carboxy-6-oxo-7-methylocta-2, 4-dienoate decarboxylase [Rhodococcus opacus M213]
MTATKIADGVIDVHAHWLPRNLFTLPPGVPFAQMHDRDGELYLGEVPLSIPAAAMSDVPAILDDMRRAQVGVRVLSAPPFAFPVHDTDGADAYVDAFNTALAEVVAGTDGALIGLGMVTFGDRGRTTEHMQNLANTPGIAGVAIPPLVGTESLDRGSLRHILSEATRLDLAVLVHPMQLPRPEWPDYYLANLIGNPVESATAVASIVLGGILDELPDLRICFVHGGGCSAGLLGRWTHAWNARPDVRRSSTYAPDKTFAKLYFDTVTHDPHQLALLRAHAGVDRILCGSDYPFDMAEPDPVLFATAHGPTAPSLTESARSFLGL